MNYRRQDVDEGKERKKERTKAREVKFLFGSRA
jgi:hypothetical protein